MLNDRKVAIIGCGNVGATTAFALMQSGLVSDIALLDYNREKAEGEALDLSHSMPFSTGHCDVFAADYDEIMDAAVIVITAGSGRKPGETRMDLINKNIGILGGILPEIKKRNYQGTLLIVSNPVDILTLAATKMSGLPSNRVIGSGTVLDTARLKTELADHLKVDPRNVHAYILGEHGDSEMVAWTAANVAGVSIADFCKMRGYENYKEEMKLIAQEVKDVAAEIIQKKGATYFGIAMGVVRICKAILMDEKYILPVSTMMNGMHGIEGICLSMPAIIGAEGVEGHVPIELSKSEENKLLKSAEAIRKVAAQVDLA